MESLQIIKQWNNFNRAEVINWATFENIINASVEKLETQIQVVIEFTTTRESIVEMQILPKDMK